MVLLQVDFEFNGPVGDELAESLIQLAHSINDEPGMIWKIWTESQALKRGGGIYLFSEQHLAERYLAMHQRRLYAMGIEEVRGLILDINTPLTNINHGPIQP